MWATTTEDTRDPFYDTGETSAKQENEKENNNSCYANETTKDGNVPNEKARATAREVTMVKGDEEKIGHASSQLPKIAPGSQNIRDSCDQEDSDIPEEADALMVNAVAVEVLPTKDLPPQIISGSSGLWECLCQRFYDTLSGPWMGSLNSMEWRACWQTIYLTGNFVLASPVCLLDSALIFLHRLGIPAARRDFCKKIVRGMKSLKMDTLCAVDEPMFVHITAGVTN